LPHLRQAAADGGAKGEVGRGPNSLRGQSRDCPARRPDRGHAGAPRRTGIFGLSVQSLPGISIEDLARAGHFRNRQISFASAGVLRRNGFEVSLSTPGKGAWHATVRAPFPLYLDWAARLSALFIRCRNPWPAR
jgi:hypothetical protein